MRKIYFVFAIVLLLPFAGKSNNTKDQLLRFPALSPDGQKVAFCFQGDIWVKSLNENNAQRLTIHEAYDYQPRWNAKGDQIAFTSNRYGSNDIFVMPSTGGVPTRLTYYSGGDVNTGWTADNSILFTSNRVFRQVEWDSEIHTVSLDGGTPNRVFDALGAAATESPDGKMIAFVRGSCRTEREAYMGPANLDLWIYVKADKSYHKLTDFEGQDHMPKWAGNHTIYYLSAEQGRYNIHQLSIDHSGNVTATGQPVTNFKDEGIRSFDVSADGQIIVFERNLGIYQMNSNREAQAIRITLPADYRFVPVEYKSYTNNINEYNVSPNGEYVAFVIRGEIFLAKNEKENKKTVRLTNHPYRDNDVQWINDTTLIFVSDREGNEDLYLIRSADPAESNMYASLKHEVVQLTKTDDDETRPVPSHNGEKLAYCVNGGKLIIADYEAETGKLNNETTLLDGWDTPGSLTWSPDDKWLAYQLSDLNFNSEIYIHKVDNSIDPVNVSMHPRGDNSPVWSPDGSKLAFLSMRNNGDNDVWFAWLKKEDWEKTEKDWELEEISGDEDKNGNGKKDKKKEVEDIEIDLEDIHERLVQVTSLPANESDLNISQDGKTFYFVSNRDSRQRYNADNDLYSVKWNGKDMKALTKNNTRPYAVQMGPNGKNLMYLTHGGSLTKMDVKSEKPSRIAFKANMNINHQKEREQIFNEAWDILNDGFYDPEFHGQDWEALKKHYKGYCMAASTDRDFRDMFNLMLGQLNASHMGLYGADREDTERERTGLLGIEGKNTKSGFKVSRVVADAPADKSSSKIYIGDIITTIDGVKIDQNTNIYSLLINKADQEVMLGVFGTTGQREVIILPKTSLQTELYNEWVDKNKRLTEKYSDGKLGYIHIQGMNWTSFERFERELMASGNGKEGIVIDVRFNGGGWTTDYLMAVLTVKQHAYTIPRGAAESLEEHMDFTEYYPFAERLPLSSWTKPSIAMCNESSYSNAEIFSHAYKSFDIGKLVGKPTFGAVISTGGAGLLGGNFVRLPFRAWYVKATNQNMENGPAVPDIIVDNDVNTKGKEEDKQLKTAVQELLKEL